ncbi:hypothetical protein DICPUDRAFT_92165 [Dictyostelium purpureum]|uniref:Steroid 5-alpha reductase C-terminal domain-containing protein n=1 Tax=Dictyostelium purpureum TaxID=5786 RepID=F0ZMZ6_DICPU|nr:uncharacterized protein DICPUDRAFT_92165 [Dictyostelium purpureum]EGC34696.1 hypothetical protein DICPUDRAFT_92165 [Dictyostelium purpureum]|eukprot:XP_003288781.1 hypothetical protein DICPUDRAFT_92165 [Dictyostelium purpureum]
MLIENYDEVPSHLQDKSYMGLKRALLVSILIIVWSGRLLIFLNDRIKKHGGVDKRFNDVRDKPAKFLYYWMMQGVWISCILTPLFLVSRQHFSISISITDYLLIIFWVCAFVMETLADVQKTIFLMKPENKNKFINIGLWKKLRHPNYFAEILMHATIYILCARGLNSRIDQMIALIAPIFKVFLMTKIATPMLEKIADNKFKSQPQYQQYKQSTWKIIPFIN